MKVPVIDVDDAIEAVSKMQCWGPELLKCKSMERSR